jgi:hypothetical protein
MKYTSNYKVKRIPKAGNGIDLSKYTAIPKPTTTDPILNNAYDINRVYYNGNDKYADIIDKFDSPAPLAINSTFRIKDIENGKPGIRHGAIINKQVVADLSKAAAKENVPLMDALSTAMRESGLGSNTAPYNANKLLGSTYLPSMVMQAWNANRVEGIPMDYDQFRLKNNLVPPERIGKTSGGYYVKDKDDIERRQNAKEYSDYINSFKVDSTLAEPFRKEMRFLKNNSGTKYNSGEKDRQSKLDREKSVILNNKDLYNYADSVYNHTLSNNTSTMKYSNGYYANLPRKDWGGALTGASNGFQMGSSMGSMFGPIGTGVGAAVGVIGGALFGNASENKKAREQKRLAQQMMEANNIAKQESDKLYKKGVRANDFNELNNISMNNSSSLFMSKGGMIKPSHRGRFTAYKQRTGKTTSEALHSSNAHVRSMAQFAVNARKFHHAMGGPINVKGMSLGDGNKLITNSRGGTSGTHESGQNIPIKKNNKTIAVGEPGEVLVNDKSISNVPFVLSKRLGFAQKFMDLENMKTSSNVRQIEVEQANLVNMNDKVAPKNKYAKSGLNLGISPITPKFNSGVSMSGLRKMGNINTLSKSTSFLGKLGIIGNNIGTALEGSNNMNTIVGAAGTLGNLLMSNKTLKYQKGLINDSLNESLSYKPKLNKNYLLNDNVDINDQVGSVNQGYASSISSLDGMDSATASALKNNANSSRISQLNSIFGNRNRMSMGIRNQNTMNIMQNNTSNNEITNQSNLMKLNARINANQELGDAASANLANNQGAISEFNTILRDSDMMKSLESRWKGTIGNTFERKYGGRIGKKKSMMMMR